MALASGVSRLLLERTGEQTLACAEGVFQAWTHGSNTERAHAASLYKDLLAQLDLNGNRDGDELAFFADLLLGAAPEWQEELRHVLRPNDSGPIRFSALTCTGGLSPENVGLGILAIEATLHRARAAAAQPQLAAIVDEMVAEAANPELATASTIDKLRVAHRVLWSHYDKEGQRLLCDGYDPEGTKQLDCDTSSFTVLTAAHEMIRRGIISEPVELIVIPGHAWLRVGGVNLDFGHVHPNSFYADKFSLPESYIASIPALSPLSLAWSNVGDLIAEQAKTKTDRRRALSAYDRALRINPHNIIALQGRGRVLLKLDKSEEALRSQERALALCPDYALALFERGRCLMARGQPAEALKCFEQSLRRLKQLKKESQAECHYAMGNALVALNRLEEAEKAYAEALKIDTEHALAHFNRAVVLAQMGRLNDSIREYEEAARCDPTCSDADFKRVGLLLRQGRFSDAAAALKMTLTR